MNMSRKSYVDEIENLFVYLETIGIIDHKDMLQFHINSYLIGLQSGKYKNNNEGLKTAFASVQIFLLQSDSSIELRVEGREKE